MLEIFLEEKPYRKAQAVPLTGEATLPRQPL
jgi:hypothetical protein